MSLRDLILQAKETQKTVELKTRMVRCITTPVNYNDSAQSFNRPGYSWVKEYGQNRVFEVFNPTGINAPNVPVLVYKLPKDPLMMAIYGVDWETLAGNLLTSIGNGKGLAAGPIKRHGVTHEWPDGGQGSDAMRIYTRAIASMQGYVSGVLEITILEGFYYLNDELVRFYRDSIDLSSYLPAAGNVVRVLISVDPFNSNTVDVKSSTELPETGYPDFPFPDAYMIPIVWVLLYSDDIIINDNRLIDARPIWNITSEADAISIQGTTVSDETPSEGQILIYRGVHGGYHPEDPSAGGIGDMLKSVYDTDGDGVVDEAEAVAWDGVTGKPSEYTPEAHNTTHEDGGSDEIDVTDLSGLLADEQDAGSIKGIEVDDTDIGDEKVLAYNSISGKLEYEEQSGGMTIEEESGSPASAIHDVDTLIFPYGSIADNGDGSVTIIYNIASDTNFYWYVDGELSTVIKVVSWAVPHDCTI